MEMFDFTLYLIYSSDDRFWVYDILMDIVENVHGIKCCIHERDFPGSGFLSDIIPQYMERSQFFVAVLSERSIKKRWIRFQLEHARDMELKENRKIFYVKLGDLRNDVPAYIQQVLDSKIFMNWPVNVEDTVKRRKFIDKLIESIRKEQLLAPCLCCMSTSDVTFNDYTEMQPLTYLATIINSMVILTLGVGKNPSKTKIITFFHNFIISIYSISLYFKAKYSFI